MNDTDAPKRIFLSPPHMSGRETAFVQEAFESNYLAPLGPQVDAFEAEFGKVVNISHSLAVSSGTAAMHLALRVLGIGPGDEVVASALTFIGGAAPIVYQGGTPVFVDSSPSTWNMDLDLLAEYLEERANKGPMPKAVVPTDLFGQAADLDRIRDVCDPYGIPVVSDAAESLGATYRGRPAGSGVTAGVFSFNGNKIVTTSGGGMLCSDDPELIARARNLSQQARDPAPHYEHSEVGYNYRMSNVLAAIGRGQLTALDERVGKKRSIFDYYVKGLGDLPGIEFMPEAPYGTSNRWLSVVLITPEQFGSDRERVRIALEEKNIESRPVWKPMHLQPVFRSGRCVGGAVSEDIFERGLCLPSGTQMTESDLDRIVDIIRKCCTIN